MSARVRVERRDTETCVVVLPPAFDVLDGAHIADLSHAVLGACRERGTQTLVIYLPHGKSANWGPERLLRLSSAGEAEAAAREAQALLRTLRGCGKRVVAAVGRDVSGPLFELALGCQRVAVVNTAHVGLDGARFGVAPILDGARSLRRRLGERAAFELLSRAELISAEQAFRIGLVEAYTSVEALVDSAAEAPHPAEAARRYLQRLAQRAPLDSLIPGGLFAFTPPAREFGGWGNARTRSGGARAALPGFARSDVATALKRQLAVASVRQSMRAGVRALASQAVEFGELCAGKQARALCRLASLEMQPSAQRIAQPTAPRPPSRLAVVGGGAVGTELVVRALLAGGVVRLLERDERALLSGLCRVRERLASHGLCGDALEQTLGRLTQTTEVTRLGQFPFVIEAAREDAWVKRGLLKELISRCPSDTLVITTSSSNSLARLGAPLSVRPPALSGPLSEPLRAGSGASSLVGAHFGLFSSRPYVELTALAPETAAETGSTEIIARNKRVASQLFAGLGYQVVEVADVGAGYVLGLATALVVESLQLAEEGYELSSVDAALTSWGFELGPIGVIKNLGETVLRGCAEALYDRAPQRFPAPGRLETLLERYSPLGRKRPSRRRLRSRGAPVPIERLVLRLVEEAKCSLLTGVVTTAEDADLGAVVGLGFPAFRGGPLAYADQLSSAVVARRLRRLAKLHGERFEPAVMLP